MKLPLSRPACRLLFSGSVCIAALLPLGSRAQLGDTLGENVQAPWPAALRFAPAPSLTPEEEAKTFKLPPGYTAELVAAEPLIHDPVAAAYDREGNLWVVEFTRFNAGMIKDLPDLAAGNTAVPGSKIVKLESSHHDGHFDRRTVWLDGLERPRGIALVADGILIGDPPHLWLARDTHGTGKCDDKIELANSFAIPGSDEEGGSLLWGRDNLLHDVSFVYDYRYGHGRAEKLPVLSRGQFGISEDDWGRPYLSRNSDQLRADLFAPRYDVRNPDATELPWFNVKIAHDQLTWPSHPTPAINRGYRHGEEGTSNGGLRADATVEEFTAACGALVYRGDNFPAAMYGQVFVPEPAGNLVHLDLLKEQAARLEAFDAPYPQTEFMTSTDTRFRPVALVNAPDGSMLVIDFYRGILEEYHILTSYLREQTLKRGLDRPMFGQGRIWRIVSSQRSDAPAAGQGQKRNVAAAPADLTDPNSFWRDTAQQALVERGDRSVVPALEDLVRQGAADYTRVAALWTLDGLKATTPELLAAALHDPSSKVRQAAVRLHERFLTAGGASAEAARAGLRSAFADPSPDVTIQVALSLGDDPSSAVFGPMRDLLARPGADPWISPALVTGLGGRELNFISDRVPPGTLTLLAASVVHRGSPAELRALAALVAGPSLPLTARAALIAGFDSYFKPVFRRTMRSGTHLASADLAALNAMGDASPDLAAHGRRILAQVGQLEEAVRAAAASARPLTGAEQQLYESGRVTFQICAACHQATGQGLPNVAPSLVDSHWVGANPEVLTRIVLNGKEGTVGFAGGMPPIGAALGNGQIAGVLTYIRNSWGLHDGAVAVDTVIKVRRQVAGRLAAWQDKDLTRVETELARLNH